MTGLQLRDRIAGNVITPDKAISAIAPFVEEATRDLFSLFKGYRMPTEAAEEVDATLGQLPARSVVM